MKKKNNKKNSYETDIMNLASKEEEIIESYSDDYNIEDDEEIIYEEEIDEKDKPEIISTSDYEEEYEDYEEPKKRTKITSTRKIKRIINIVFIIIMLLLAMIATDVICVGRYDVGPFFAIPTKTYKDGGTKEYYGLGYKVIKYNQMQGRRDREIGTWSLKYNTEPITNKDVDLAIEFYGNEAETYEKYYRKFVRITSTLQKVDTKNNKITIGYKDEGGKYTLDIYCTVVKDQTNLSELKVGESITIIGTVSNFKQGTDTKANRLYIKNCFAEQ